MQKTLKIKPISPKIGVEIPLPEYATPGSAGMDLRACIDGEITILPGQTVCVPTGIAIALPDASCVALICARSGLSVKHGINLANSVGVIDSDYRGELIVGLINQSSTAYTISPGERIAQMLIMPVMQCKLEICAELEDTLRGRGGFGSTGKGV